MCFDKPVFLMLTLFHGLILNFLNIRGKIKNGPFIMDSIPMYIIMNKIFLKDFILLSYSILN